MELKNIRNQLYMLERVARAMRVQVEAQQEIAEPSGWSNQVISLRNGLTTLLSTCDPITNPNPAPYERFFPETYLGYSTGDAQPEIEIKTRSYQAPEASTEVTHTESSCLVIKVANPMKSTNAWLTLETGLNLSAVLASHSMEVRTILSFLNHSPFPLSSYGLQLGVTDGSGYSAIHQKSYPALDVPLELSYHVTADQLLAIPRQGLEKLSLIITLPIPPEGEYTAILSHFEILLKQRNVV